MIHITTPLLKRAVPAPLPSRLILTKKISKVEFSPESEPYFRLEELPRDPIV